MAVDHIQVPPDSTGKRVHQHLGMEVTFVSGTIAFNVGDTVVGATSGVTGEVIEVEGTTSAGTIYIVHKFGTAKVFTASENLQVGGVTNAVFSAQTNFYTQKSVLAGHNNPLNGMFVDDKGQGYVRFAEGAPQLDAFGKLRVSQPTLLGDYQNSYHVLGREFQQITASGGTIAHIAANGGVLMSTTTTSGSQAKLGGHTYHKYQSGISQLIEITCACGDSGKANVDRIWGYGDDSDGIFFRLNGTTLQAMIRNSTGSTAATVTIDQADWNLDKLDGTGLSRFTVDVTKNNIWWIDFQWMGAGSIRFGIVQDGERIVCHEQAHANTLSGPYMRTGSLPVYFEQINTGTAGSGSEFRYWCATVKTEGRFTPLEFHFSGSLPSATVTGANKLLGSFRSKQTLNSINNRSLAYGENLSVISTAEPIRIDIIKNATLTSPTWTGDPNSSSGVEFDTGASGFSGGTIIESYIVSGNGNEKLADLTAMFDIMKEKMRRHYTITDTDTYSIVASLLTGTTTDVYLTANWKEHH